MSKPRERSPYYDIIEDLNTDNIRWIVCPAEPDGEDNIGSCEVNYTTGQFYCHNCKRYGTIAELYQLQQNKLLN